VASYGASMDQRYTEQQIEANFEKESILVCPLCFVKPPGKYFTYFDCGHVLCSHCAAMNSHMHNCPSCNSLHFILYKGVSMSTDLYEA
jgi:hypothetical protein